MAYSVKEVFYTLQGEGFHTGRPAVFLRFAGCNLWTGLEKDRADAVCTFCDTDFVGTDGPGGGKFPSADSLADHTLSMWPSDPTVESATDAQTEHVYPGTDSGRPFVVCTGGEPLLQLDTELIDALHERGFEIAVETNGTLAAPDGLDWICVSPKRDAPLVQTTGNELKLVYPQTEALPERFVALAFEHFYLQPMDGPLVETHTQAALTYCLTHPRWNLSIQTHKLLRIP